MTKRHTGSSRRVAVGVTNNKDTVVVTPNASDVLFGRGGHVNHNPANQKYLRIVMDRKEQYNSCKKTDKAGIAWDIMADLRLQDPSTRFLRKDYETGLWHIVPDSDVRRKISQCLRERMVPVIPQPKKNKLKQSNSTVQKAATATAPETMAPKRTTRSTTRIRLQLPKQEEPEMENFVSEALVLSTLLDCADDEESRVPLVDCKTDNREDEVEEEAVSHKAETPAVPSLEVVEPARKRSSYYSLSSGTWQDYNPKTGTWEEASPSSQSMETGNRPAEEAVPPPPPMPRPVPMKSEESNNRAWSDFFASSLASFTPSIFDASGHENTWENMMDPTSLPQLMPEDDEESLMGSQTSSSSSSSTAPEQFDRVVPLTKRTVAHYTADSQGGCHPPMKKQKTDASVRASVDPLFHFEGITFGMVQEDYAPPLEPN